MQASAAMLRGRVSPSVVADVLAFGDEAESKPNFVDWKPDVP